MTAQYASGFARHNRVLLPAFIGILLTTPHLWAADSPTNSPDTADLMQMSLEQLMAIPVHTASRRSQDAGDAPAFVTVVTADSIKKFGYRTLADVLRATSGFYVSSDRNYEYVGIRGFSRPGDYNTRVLLLLDGARMNENIYDSGGIGTDAVMDLDDVERIEIVRGPGSSLYGTSAFLGVINIIPRTGRDRPGTELSVATGSHDLWQSRFSQGLVYDSGLALYLSGSLHNDPGDWHDYPEFDSPQTHEGRTPPRADRDEAERLYFNAAYKDLFFQAGYVDRLKHIPTAPWETVFGDTRTRSEDSRLFADLRADHAFSPELSTLLRIGCMRYNYNGWYAYDSGDTSAPGTYINRDEALGEQWLTEAVVHIAAIPRHNLTFGGEHRWNTRQDQKNYVEGSGEPGFDQSNRSTVWALFAQDEFRLFEPLLLNAGIRYDEYEDFSGRATPRLGLILKPLDGTALKLLYGRAFRAPNAYELYYNDNGVTQKTNPDLEPEDIETWEFVVEQRLSRKIQATATIYDYRMDDLISQTVDPNDGLIVFDNIGRVHGRGAQAVLMGRFDNGVQGQAAYSLMDTEDRDTGSRLSNSPRNMVKLALSAPLSTRRLFAGLELQFMDERTTLAGARTEAVWLANATLLHRRLVEGLEASISVYNLLDHKYADPAAEEHAQDSIEQDGRTLRVKLTCRF